MAKKPKQAATVFDRAWHRLAPLLQLDLFEDKDALAGNALPELHALEQRLGEHQKTRST
jgi:hypothetical protein